MSDYDIISRTDAIQAVVTELYNHHDASPDYQQGLACAVARLAQLPPLEPIATPEIDRRATNV